MKIIERNDLRVGYIISYVGTTSDRVLQGTVVHLGLGVAARHAVWVRCLEGLNRGRVEGLLLDQVMGVISYASH